MSLSKKVNMQHPPVFSLVMVAAASQPAPSALPPKSLLSTAVTTISMTHQPCRNPPPTLGSIPTSIYVYVNHRTIVPSPPASTPIHLHTYIFRSIDKRFPRDQLPVARQSMTWKAHCWLESSPKCATHLTGIGITNRFGRVLLGMGGMPPSQVPPCFYRLHPRPSHANDDITQFHLLV